MRNRALGSRLITAPSGALANVPTIGSVPSLLMSVNWAPRRGNLPCVGTTLSAPPSWTVPVTERLLTNLVEAARPQIQIARLQRAGRHGKEWGKRARI